MLNQLHIKANGCFIYLEVILDLINNQTITLRQIKDIPGTLSGKRNLFSRAQIRLSFLRSIYTKTMLTRFRSQIYLRTNQT